MGCHVMAADSFRALRLSGQAEGGQCEGSGREEDEGRTRPNLTYTDPNIDEQMMN